MRITLFGILLVPLFLFHGIGMKTASVLSVTPSVNELEQAAGMQVLVSLYGASQDNKLKVYHNPVNKKDRFHIRMEDSGVKRLAFYDITGKVVKVVETKHKSFSFSISDLDS